MTEEVIKEIVLVAIIIIAPLLSIFPLWSVLFRK